MYGGVRRYPAEVEQLVGSTEERGARPIVQLDWSPRVRRDTLLERGERAERSVYDLSAQRGVGTIDRSAAKLGIQSGRCPRVVMEDALKNPRRYFSCGSYHSTSLAGSSNRARRLEAADRA